MINDEPAVPRLVAIDRRQLLLRTMDVKKLVDDAHSVRAIWELISPSALNMPSTCVNRSLSASWLSERKPDSVR